MGIEVKGMPEIISLLQDDEILWAVKRRTLRDVALEATLDANDASAQIKDTGMLEKSWRNSFYSDEGIATARVYSTSYHDIYNELGSPKNMKHVGFYSRTVDANMEKYYDMIEEGVFKK